MSGHLVVYTDQHVVQQGGDFFCTIGVDGLGDADSAVRPPSYVLCVDRSGSMSEPAYPGGPTRFDIASVGLREALSRLNDSVTVALVGYAASASCVWEGDARDAKRDLVGITGLLGGPGGATNFEAALLEAQGHIGRTPNRRILLFTDGHATHGKGANDPTELAQMRDELGEAGIFIDALGIGRDCRTVLLEQIVGNTGCVLYAGETADEAARLGDTVSLAFAGWSSAVGSLHVLARVHPAFGVIDAWHSFPEGRRLPVPQKGSDGTRLGYNLGAIGIDERQRPVILLRIRAPRQLGEDLPLMQVKANLRTPEGERPIPSRAGESLVAASVTLSAEGGERDPQLRSVYDALVMRRELVDEIAAEKDPSKQMDIYQRGIDRAAEAGNPEGLVGEFKDAFARLKGGQNSHDVANRITTRSSKMHTPPRRQLGIGLERQGTEVPPTPF
jgi:hypothetical protein